MEDMSNKDLRRKSIRAFVLVRTKPGTSEDIVRSRRIRGVKIANSVFGRYDAVVVIEAKTLDELKKIIYEMVEKHQNVVHTETLISLFQPLLE
ncbi:AsnC family transcriptional regulator [Candidatus Bathyarchaeota archaeon ex4484_205]|nr:MAG: AsnC family transcriptional regulator [Candidatus Bathyarchaeota archaeon ex4484_205]RLG67048.1 MAG: Lrp/AsnC family transcriptional regulator [archaeon]